MREGSAARVTGLAARLPPEVAAGLGALSRVARALTGPGALDDVARRALEEMRAALGLDACVLYLPDAGGRPVLRRFLGAAAPEGPASRGELAFDQDAWRLAVAGGAPIVFREAASWLVANPFEPAARHWLVLPLAGGGPLVGVVVAARANPVELDPLGVTVLTLLASQLHTGITTARMRLELEQAALDRERARLAGEVHDGLAQDLALAVRELALLEEDRPPAEVAASRARLAAAVGSANRVVRARLLDLTAPVPAGGLRTGVETAARRAGERGTDVHVSFGTGRLDADPDVTAVALRVLTEALANAERHAPGARVEVALTVPRPGRLALCVHDDGPGFDPGGAPGAAEGHLGLSLMRRRALAAGAELAIESAPGAGTRITLEVPAGA